MWPTVDDAGRAIGRAVVIPVFMTFRGGSVESFAASAVFDNEEEAEDSPDWGELNAGRLAGTTGRGSARVGVAADVDGPGAGCSSCGMEIVRSLTCGLWEKRQFGREHDCLSGQGALWKRPREENMIASSSRRVEADLSSFFTYPDHDMASKTNSRDRKGKGHSAECV